MTRPRALACAIVIAASTTPSAAQPACHPFESEPLSSLVGLWAVHWSYRVGPGDWLEIAATSDVSYDLLGCALVERFTTQLDTIPYNAISIVTEPEYGRFDRLTVDSQHGGLMKHDGQMEGDTLVFVWQAKIGDRLVRTRHTFLLSENGTVLREQYLSRDEGELWELRQRMTYKPLD